jgi:hypothetical protein
VRWPFSMRRTGGWREYAEICCVSDTQVDRTLEEKKTPDSGGAKLSGHK